MSTSTKTDLKSWFSTSELYVITSLSNPNGQTSSNRSHLEQASQMVSSYARLATSNESKGITLVSADGKTTYSETTESSSADNLSKSFESNDLTSAIKTAFASHKKSNPNSNMQIVLISDQKPANTDSFIEALNAQESKEDFDFAVTMIQVGSSQEVSDWMSSVSSDSDVTSYEDANTLNYEDSLVSF